MTKFKQVLSKIAIVLAFSSVVTLSVYANLEDKDFFRRSQPYWGVAATGLAFGATHMMTRRATFLRPKGPATSTHVVGWGLCTAACVAPAITTHKLLNVKWQSPNDLGATGSVVAGLFLGIPVSAVAGVGMNYGLRRTVQALKMLK